MDCVIPARAGSKRIEHKNILDIAGKPMLAWSILAAKQSGLFRNVYCSSDSLNYLRIAEDYGAEPIVREKALANDQTTTGQLMRDFAQTRTHVNDSDLLVCLYATALMTPQILREGMTEHMVESDAMLLCAAEFPHPISRAIVQRGDTYSLLSPEFAGNVDGQTPSYFDLGKFYCASYGRWRQDVETLSGKLQIFLPPRWLWFDVNEPKDLLLASQAFLEEGLPQFATPN